MAGDDAQFVFEHRKLNVNGTHPVTHTRPTQPGRAKLIYLSMDRQSSKDLSYKTSLKVNTFYIGDVPGNDPFSRAERDIAQHGTVLTNEHFVFSLCFCTTANVASQNEVCLTGKNKMFALKTI